MKVRRMLPDTKMPPFGNWEHCDEIPITQYFESKFQSGPIPPSRFGEEDIFRAPPLASASSACACRGRCRRKGRVIDSTTSTPTKRRSVMAVDEDLYKIPPELLYQTHTPKRVPSSFSLAYSHSFIASFQWRKSPRNNTVLFVAEEAVGEAAIFLAESKLH